LGHFGVIFKESAKRKVVCAQTHDFGSEHFTLPKFQREPWNFKRPGCTSFCRKDEQPRKQTKQAKRKGMDDSCMYPTIDEMMLHYRKRNFTGARSTCPKCCTWPECMFYNEVVLDSVLLGKSDVAAIFYVDEELSQRSIAYTMSKSIAAELSRREKIPLIRLNLFAEVDNFVLETPRRLVGSGEVKAADLSCTLPGLNGRPFRVTKPKRSMSGSGSLVSTQRNVEETTCYYFTGAGDRKCNCNPTEKEKRQTWAYPFEAEINQFFYQDSSSFSGPDTIRDNEWPEVMRWREFKGPLNCCDGGFYGTWFFIMPGSGIQAFIGKAIRFSSRDELHSFLKIGKYDPNENHRKRDDLEVCARVLERNFDSAMFVNDDHYVKHESGIKRNQTELVICNPNASPYARKYKAAHVKNTRVPPTPKDKSKCPIGMSKKTCPNKIQLKASTNQKCNCDDSKWFLNCDGSDGQ
jgi:hypothetical protein